MSKSDMIYAMTAKSSLGRLLIQSHKAASASGEGRSRGVTGGVDAECEAGEQIFQIDVTDAERLVSALNVIPACNQREEFTSI